MKYLVRLAAVLAFLTVVSTAIVGRASDIPRPNYPRVDMCPWYEPDAAWPQRPADWAWGAIPAIEIDKQGNIWVFSRSKPPVQVYTPEGKPVRGWGDDTIVMPHGLRFDPSGNVWVTDVKLHVAMLFTPEGKLLRTLGTRGEAGCDAVHMNMPTDVAVGPGGDVFVSDGYGNSRVAHFDKNGKFVKEWGKLGTAPGEFSLVHSIVMDSKGRLYVADRNNARVQVFDQQGKFLAQWRNLIVPWTLSITKGDEIWACGSSPMAWRAEDKLLGCPPRDQLIMKFDATGRALQLWTLPRGEPEKLQPGEVDWLHAIAIDANGNLYVGDIKGQHALKLLRKGP